MPHKSSRTPAPAGPEIDNVIERAAGLRSLREAGRILGVDAATVLAVLERDALPNAFQSAGGHWRIPIEDIQRLMEHAEERRRRPPDTPSAAHAPNGRHNASAPAWMDSRATPAPAKRRRHIVAELREHRSVRVSRLAEDLGVSDMTIRRDLAHLESEGRLQRAYGGAIAVK
jgi:DNA-binding GntR family transcriptional regulator